MNEKEEKQFEELLNEIKSIRLSKSNDYGNSWKILGLMGIIYAVMGKAIRIWNLRRKEPSNESLRDSFRDLSIYALMGIQLLDNDEIEPLI